VERGETTPGFDNSDDAQMDFALFKGWFLKHTQDLGASIRHRNEFLNYNGRGVPIDEVLQKLQMLQQRCNQHVDNPQDHVTQQELWNKISKLLDTRALSSYACWIRTLCRTRGTGTFPRTRSSRGT
jgi:hypothetical protein